MIEKKKNNKSCTTIIGDYLHRLLGDEIDKLFEDNVTVWTKYGVPEKDSHLPRNGEFDLGLTTHVRGSPALTMSDAAAEQSYDRPPATNYTRHEGGYDILIFGIPLK